MSELQIALIAIGALIIIAVLFINWWQERRFHHQVEKSFSPLQRDALLDEPSMDKSDFVTTTFNEPKFDDLNFDKNEFLTTANSLLDDKVAGHFTLDETLSQNNQYENTDRFVALPQENAAERVMQAEESIDDTYNELINSKLDRLTAQSVENIKPAGFSQSSNQPLQDEQASDFRSVFDEALGSDSKSTSSPDTTQDKSSHIEPSITLPEMLHGQIDLTALIYLSNETPVSTLNKALALLFDNFDKPVYVHVLDSNKQWHLLKDILTNQDALNRQISKVACSLQLADRGGAVERSTLNRFQLAVETLGLDINGHVEWQNAGDALSAANSLDLFCIEVDKTIGFHLVHGESGAFTGTKLRGLAEAQGLILTSDGAFKYFDQSSDDLISSNKLKKPQLHPSFIMFNRDDHTFSPEMLRASVVKSVTFQLDIPHVKQSAETFNQMIQVAKQMEVGLNAVLVDGNNKVLGDIQIEKIRQQIKVLQASMLVRGIVPGSDSAHRLFS